MHSTLKEDLLKSAKSEEDVERLFCKKYSRIKMDKDVWSRIDFENYKRMTKNERVEKLKTQITPRNKLS